jgi:ATP-dependent DNA helicase RecG
MLLTKSLLHTTDVYVKKLREAGIETVRDFLMLFPKDYEDKSDVLSDFSLVNITEKQAIKCTIELLTSEMTRNKKLLIKAVLTDARGSHAEAVWFNQRLILSKFAKGDTVLIYGKPKYEYGRLSFPSCEIEHFSAKRQEIAPLYSDVNYIPGSWIRDKMAYVKPYISELPLEKGGSGDLVPEEIRKKHGFRTQADNIRAIHFPTGIPDFKRAKYELGYAELFRFQLR